MRRVISVVLCIWLCNAGADAQVTPDTAIEKRIQRYQTIVTGLWLNRPDSAIRYAREAINLANRSNDIKSRAITIRLLGGVHLYTGNYDSALICSQKALQLSVQTHDSILISSAFNNIGFTEFHFGNYARALDNLLKALTIKRRIGSTYGLGHTINNIGLVYLKLKDYDQAKTYFTEALQVTIRIADANQQLYSRNNLGFAYLQSGDYLKAEDWFMKAIAYSRTLNNNNWVAAAYSGLGQAKLKMKKTKEGLVFLNHSLRLRKAISDLTGISEIYYFLSQANAAAGNYDSALYKLRISQSIAKKIGSRSRQLENYDWLSALFLRKNEMDSAFHYQTRYVKLKDSLFSENLARELAAIQLQSAEEENLAKISEKDMQLLKRSNLIDLLITVVIFSLILAGIFFYNYQRKLKYSLTLVQKNEEIVNKNEEIVLQQESLLLSNKELEAAKDQINKQNELLQELNVKLQATVDVRTHELELANNDLKISNFELDHFIYRSSHDLRGPLVRLLGVCHVAQIDVEDAKAKKYFQLIEETSRHLNELFDRLKSVSEINNTDIEQSRIQIDFHSLLRKVRSRLEKMDSYHNIRFNEEIQEGLSFTAPELLMDTLFHGLLENSVKFQNQTDSAEKMINVKVRKKKNSLVIAISDNGIGIEESYTPFLFDMFSLAARDKGKIGLGLYMVKQAVEKMTGSISFDKTKSNYTRFKIDLPFPVTR